MTDNLNKATAEDNLSNLFNEDSQETSTNARNLTGTAQLTAIATTVTSTILKTIDEDFETYKELVAKSKTDHGAMDELVTTAFDLTTVDVQFLLNISDATIDGMLKSQQSKRSRSKGKVMTMDNYSTMMTGAVAENLIRITTGKTKAAAGSRRVSGIVDYTAEELAAYEADQDKLRKEIRNVQSKKSIMKSKAGFSEEDERWLSLLIAEEQLKKLRVETAKVVLVDETKDALAEMLGDVDVTSLKAADAKDLLAQALALIGNKEAENDN